MTRHSFAHRLRSRLNSLRGLARDAGSVSLEQIAITAGFTLLALAAVAAVGAVVNHYTGVLNHLI